MPPPAPPNTVMVPVPPVTVLAPVPPTKNRAPEPPVTEVVGPAAKIVSWPAPAVTVS